MTINNAIVSSWIEKSFWSLIVAIACSGVSTLKELTVNVNELNQKMAVMLEKMADHDQRIHYLEDRTYRRSK